MQLCSTRLLVVFLQSISSCIREGELVELGSKAEVSSKSLDHAAVKELRTNLESARSEALKAMGVAEKAVKESEWREDEDPKGKQVDSVRMMQFNLLADGLADDGFLVRMILDSWKHGADKVPKEGKGGSEDYMKMLQEVENAKGNAEKLKELQAKYSGSQVPAEGQNMRAVINWKARELQIKLMVLAAGRPDVLVFEELDHFGSIAQGLNELGYVSQVSGKVESYQPAHLGAVTPGTLADHIVKTGHTFLPKLYSNAFGFRIRDEKLQDRMLAEGKQMTDKCAEHKKKKILTKECLEQGTARLFTAAGVNGNDYDDDGVGIFWRADSFEAEHVKVHFTESGQGTLQVNLKGLGDKSDRKLVVLGTHLSSGSSEKEETDRVTKEVEPEDKKGLVNFFKEAQEQNPDAAVVLLLDANSFPQQHRAEGRNVWQLLHNATGASVWDPYFDLHGKSTLDPAPVTTNKMRGPGSVQAKKIGEHAYYLIDHIFYDPMKLKFKQHALEPTRFPSDKKALEALLPTLKNPSDHYPVVADLTWLGVTEQSCCRRAALATFVIFLAATLRV